VIFFSSTLQFDGAAMMESRRPLSVSEAASELGLTDYLVRQAIREGLLDAFRVGRTLRIRPASVARLLSGGGQAPLQPRRAGGRPRRSAEAAAKGADAVATSTGSTP